MNTDKVIKLINAGVLNASNITIQGVRKQTVHHDLGLHDQLQRGRAIFQHKAHLDQYLFSYGKMLDAQWSVVQEIAIACSDVFSAFSSCINTHVYDYGAGQGLSTLGILHTLEGMTQHNGPSWDVQHILQMDPSAVALQRAASIAKCKAPQAQLHCQHAYISQTGALFRQQGVLHVHVFSNTIDVVGFQYPTMVQAALVAPGIHLFVVVSSDRSCYGGTVQVQHAYRLVTGYGSLPNGKQVLWDSGMQRFGCNGAMHAVSFVSLVEVQ